nr:transposase [Azonexus sp. R2A61]
MESCHAGVPVIATALVAASGASGAHSKNARHFVSWFELIPKESSSGNSRKLG